MSIQKLFIQEKEKHNNTQLNAMIKKKFNLNGIKAVQNVESRVTCI